MKSDFMTSRMNELVTQLQFESALMWDRFEEALRLMTDVIRSGGYILVCGNGGSAADAAHLTGELVGSISRNFSGRGFRCLDLTAPVATISAIANDWGFDYVFARQIEAIGSPNDLLITFSTSGESLNIIEAIESAHKSGLKTLAFSKVGSTSSLRSNHAIDIASFDTQIIQEMHLHIYHSLCLALNQQFSNSNESCLNG